ncbi:type II toxin-antitoxin system death-on-curing family toxin [Sedimentitalea sp. JM2-8]|uniref:Type II toxin-antitoxin system death-on-curing family toxin n=1 Tax=Sedimentitalea xiamensis TaxID=3050037 RepID=A0ABT7FJQ2_9RHOB|nr:type II toxin-antitoxin system death-on-curing family toxin [Sedimentitalea xiamensis]MDK3075369.1 type II toxin-antitoxin system death-on-curing family toxin [Sedimentitalea xiamensis]
MTEWVWVPLPALHVIHDRQIARHGGASGTRNPALLESAIARPLNQAGHGDPDAYALAAAYAFGVAKAHAFVDGNKRMAFVAAFTFLRLNGIAIRPEPAIGVRMMEDLASDKVSEDDFAAWLRSLGSG